MKISARCLGLLALVPTAFPCAGQTPAQLDLRFRDTLGTENQTHEFVRFTILPKGWFADVIQAKNGKELSARYAGGPLVLKNKSWETYLAGSFSPSPGHKVLGQGLQVYWAKKMGRLPTMKLAAPVLELYQDLKPSKNILGLKENEQLLIFLKPKLALGQETFINKPFGANIGGYYGLTANVWPDTHKKLMLEAGVFRSLKSEWILRLRVVINFSLGRKAASLTN